MHTNMHTIISNAYSYQHGMVMTRSITELQTLSLSVSQSSLLAW